MKKLLLVLIATILLFVITSVGAQTLEIVFAEPGDFEARETDYGWMVGPPGTDLVRIEKCGSKCQQTWPQYFNKMSPGTDLYLFTVFIRNRWLPVATTSSTGSRFLEKNDKKTDDLMWWHGTAEHVIECRQLHDFACHGECLAVDCKDPAGAAYAVYKRAKRVL